MATTSADARWWVRYPRRWRQETADLRAAGATHRILRAIPSHAEPEVRQIAVEWPSPDGDALSLTVTYPDAYPFFPPAFAAVEAQGITRHRNPVSGQLCLVADGQWHPNLTAANVLAEQVPVLLAANQEDPASGERTSVVEMDEAEGSRVFTIGTAIAALFTAPTAPAARATSTCGLARVLVGSSSPGLTLVVDQLAGLDGRIPDQPDDESVWDVHPLTTSTRSVPWVRLDRELIPTDTPDALWEWAVNQLPQLHHPSARTPFILVAFRDEVAHREIGWRWLVIFHLGEDRSVWAFGQDVSPQALRARVPGYEGLADASVALVGAGSLGLPIAVGLARLGIGEMHIIDGAGVRAATVCRQHTLADVGRPKADAAADAAAMINPYLEVTSSTVLIGHSKAPNADVGAHLAQVDLVVDAAANSDVSRWLALGPTPLRQLITVAATWGAWGGTILRLPATGGGCWACAELGREGRTLAWPPASPAAAIADGCSAPTFPGAAHDLADLAHHTVRVAAAQLCGTGDSWADFHTLAHRRDDGTPTVPTWRTAALTVHPDCQRIHPAADESPKQVAVGAGAS